MRHEKKIWLSVSIVGAIAVVIVITMATQFARATAPPSLTASQIDSDALSISSALGDSSPTTIQSVTGSRSEENELASGEQVPDTGQSVLIAVKGNFTDTSASVPQGASAPTGTVLTLVVDATTNTITDLGLNNSYPNLASLGPVTTESTSSEESVSIRRAQRARRDR